MKDKDKFKWAVLISIVLTIWLLGAFFLFGYCKRTEAVRYKIKAEDGVMIILDKRTGNTWIKTDSDSWQKMNYMNKRRADSPKELEKQSNDEKNNAEMNSEEEDD